LRYLRALTTLSVLVTCLNLVACQETGVDPVQQGVATITAEALLEDVSALAAPRFGGRLPGTPGYEAAARWAAARFKNLGLEPGGDDGYLQHLPIELNEIQGTPVLEVTGADGLSSSCVLGRDFVCRGFSGSGEVSGPVVFVGYGLHAPERGYDDYADVDVTGAIVLCLKRNPSWQPGDDKWEWEDSTPRARAAAAVVHGAAALLWVEPEKPEREHDRGPIGSVLHGSGSHHPEFPHLEISERVADQLVGRVGGLRELQVTIDGDQVPHSQALASRARVEVQASYDPARESCNVVAVLPGSDDKLKEEALILGAHLDHVGRQSPEFYFPGANDNASGSAAILRLAEAFVRSGERPRRTVVFVLFAGEESGLVGAEYHAEHPYIALDHTRAMFNFDCIAHGDSIRIGGGKSAVGLWDRARSLDAAHARMSTAATWEGGGADAQPFYDKDVQTLYWVTTNSYRHLHAPTDTPETLNGPLYEELVKLGFRTAWEVAQGG